VEKLSTSHLMVYDIAAVAGVFMKMAANVT